MCETSFFQQARVQHVILVHMRFSVVVQFTRRHQRYQLSDVSPQSNSPHVVQHPINFESSDVKFTFSHTQCALSSYIFTLAHHTPLSPVLSQFHRAGPVSPSP